MDANQVCSEVIPVKDVDCFTPENVGKLCHGNPLFIPCAPQAVLTLLEEAGTNLEGERLRSLVGFGLRCHYDRNGLQL